MKVCATTRLSFLPNTSLRSGSSVVWTPTGIGKVRGSMIESEITLIGKNHSSVLSFRKRGVTQGGRPSARRPLLFLRLVDADRAIALVGVLVVRIEPALATMPSVSMMRQRSGTGT
jgi:hypothetical protein